MIIVAAVTLLTFLPPLLAYVLLHAEGLLIYLLAYCALVELLFIARWRTTGTVRLVSSVLLSIVVGFGALTIIIGLNITPASAYLAWFKLVVEGVAGGTLAYMFAIKYGFFSALFGGMLFTSKPTLPLLGYLFINLLLSAVILQNMILAAAAAVALLPTLFFSTIGRIRALGRAAIIPVAEVVLASLVVAAPLSLSVSQNDLINSLFSLNVEGVVARLFPNFPFLYNVPGYGHSFSSSDLGERPALTSRPVFEVLASPGRTIYLRNAVYDVYNGSGWSIAPQDLPKKPETAPPTGSPEAYLPGGGSSTLDLRPGAPGGSGLPDRISVTLLIDFYSTIPHTLHTTEVQTNTAALPPLSMAGFNTGFVLSRPLIRGTRIVDRIDPSAGSPPPPLGKEERANDIQVGRIPESVVRLARELGQNRDKSATLQAIRDFLASNYVYSLNTEAAPPNTDSVADFLFHSRTGYCVQFATAFVVLARLNEIPARYVTGFLVNMPEDSDKATVTGLQAHSWAEAWLPGTGWTTEEATPPMESSSWDNPSFYSEFNPTDSRYTQRQLEAIMGGRIPTPPVPQTPHRRLPLLPVGIGLALLAAGIFLVRSGVRALSSRRVKARRIIATILKHSARRDLPDPSHDGWFRWAAEVAARKLTRGVVAGRATHVIQQIFFGARLPRRRDLRFLASISRRCR